MQIDKLTQGMEFKNYKALCDFLEIEYKIGKAKQFQMAEIERFVEMHKVGNKIIIDEVLAMPVEKIDKRKDPKKISNNSTYSKDIQALIISLLAGSDGHAVYIPVNRMLRVLDMVNCNYSEAKKAIPKLSEITQVPESYCYDFFNNNNIQLKKKVETALKGLANRALVSYKQSISVCVLVNDIEFTSTGDIKVTPSSKKECVSTYHREHREATELEEKMILRAKEEVLEEFRCSTLQYVFLTGRWAEFQKKVNALLLERANIEYYYDSYKIIYNADSIDKAYLKQLEQEERTLISNNLNSNIIKMINKNSSTIHKRALRKEIPNTIELLQATDNYETHVKTLSEVVIKKDAKDIRRELKKPLKTKVEQVTFDDV